MRYCSSSADLPIRFSVLFSVLFSILLGRSSGLISNLSAFSTIDANSCWRPFRSQCGLRTGKHNSHDRKSKAFATVVQCKDRVSTGERMFESNLILRFCEALFSSIVL